MNLVEEDSPKESDNNDSNVVTIHGNRVPTEIELDSMSPVGKAQLYLAKLQEEGEVEKIVVITEKAIDYDLYYGVWSPDEPQDVVYMLHNAQKTY